jgi:adenylylsulfate kinase
VTAPAIGRTIRNVTTAPCVWLTGRRGAGKHTLGTTAAEMLHGSGQACAVLDAAALTEHLARGPADGGLTSLVWLIDLLTSNGVPVIVTVDTPSRQDRDAARETLPNFVEVHVDAPADVCTARAGLQDSRYEEPIAPDFRVPTADRDVRASAALLVSHLETLLAP